VEHDSAIFNSRTEFDRLFSESCDRFDCKCFAFMSLSSIWYNGDLRAYIIAFSGDVHHVRFLFFALYNGDIKGVSRPENQYITNYETKYLS
jgi:esterase/lipase superfamily enzyme